LGGTGSPLSNLSIHVAVSGCPIRDHRDDRNDYRKPTIECFTAFYREILTVRRVIAD
jgi:hypothetical protein